MKLAPSTKNGLYSTLLIVAMFIFFCLGALFVQRYEGISSGETILADIETRPLVALNMVTGFIAGLMGFVVGLTSIVTKNDRSILVCIATIIGALVFVLLIGELLFPH